MECWIPWYWFIQWLVDHLTVMLKVGISFLTRGRTQWPLQFLPSLGFTSSLRGTARQFCAQAVCTNYEDPDQINSAPCFTLLWMQGILWSLRLPHQCVVLSRDSINQWEEKPATLFYIPGYMNKNTNKQRWPSSIFYWHLYATAVDLYII